MTYVVNVDDLNQFDRKLRRYSLDSKLELCRMLCHMIDTHMSKKDFISYAFINGTPAYFDQIKSHIQFFEVDYLAKMATVLGEWDGIITDLNKRRDFGNLINLLKKYCPPFTHAKDSELENPNLDLFLTRTALQQFKYQENNLIHLYRYSFLFEYQSERLDVKSKFIDLFGFAYGDYVKFITGLYLLSYHSYSTMSIEYIKREVGKGSILTPQVVEEMISVLSMKREEAVEKYNLFKSKDERMRIYDYNPHSMKPMLLHESHVYLPIPQLLFKSITQGFYHMMCFVYKEGFRSDFGKHAFEDYIYHVLNWRKGDYDAIIPEFEYYIEKQRNDSPDFMLVKDADVILVEVKANAPKIQLREADQKTYDEELYKAYGKAVIQCVKKEKHIRDGLLTHPKLPSSINRISYLVVTLEDFYIMSSGTMREKIEQMCIEKGETLNKDRLFHVMGTATLERILEADNRTLFEFLHTREKQEPFYPQVPSTEIHLDKSWNECNSVKYWTEMVTELGKDLFG